MAGQGKRGQALSRRRTRAAGASVPTRVMPVDLASPSREVIAIAELGDLHTPLPPGMIAILGAELAIWFNLISWLSRSPDTFGNRHGTGPAGACAQQR